MDRDVFERTRHLFDAALARPREEWPAFLKEACGSDTALHEQVERLLKHAKIDPDPPEAPPPSAPVATAASATVGTFAPDFDLPCVSAGLVRGNVTLSEFRGRWLVLLFYPRDFSLICPTELTAMSARREEFSEAGAEIVGISVDSIESHERWLTTPKSRGGLGVLNFALASDENGATCRAYGVYLEQQHVALRGVFVIDPNGILQFQAVHNLSIGRRSDDILRVVSALQTGGLCAEDWAPGTDTLDPIEALDTGSVVSHYRIEERVGDGSFGSVFRAQDLTLQRTVALKVIKADSLPPGAVLDEARAAAALNHTNICTVFAVDDDEGIPFIAMEYVHGQPLSELIDGQALPAERAADIAHQIATGMAAAHAMGISHGDLKPANVIVRDDGVAKILDFGLARLARPALDPGATTLRSPVGLRGTPAYMSPEQASGSRATPQSDVFSLGIILYEMLTGRRAFPGPTIPEILDEIQAVEPSRFASAVPEPFASVVRRSLVREADQRDITMQEIAQTLQGT